MEELTVYYNARVLRGYNLEHGELWVKGNKIIDPSKLPRNCEYKKINCENLILSPGLIDLQVNGAFGVDFLTNPNLPRALEYVNKKMLSTGVTLYCPTLITSPPEFYYRTLPHIKPCNGSAKTGAGILGVHCEGPFISKVKRGAHPDNYIIELNDNVEETVEFKSTDSENKDSSNEQSKETLSENKKNPKESKKLSIKEILTNMYGDLSNIRLITFASEFSRSIEAITYLTEHHKDIIISLGHSETDFENAVRAVKSGARMITHLFNAMPAFHHRNPSLPGLLCSDVSNEVYFGIIADGIHTHATALCIAYSLSPKNLVLVTDALAPMNLKNGEYNLGKQIIVVSNNRATVKGTDTLCGCISSLPYCMKYFTDAVSCPISYTLAAAALHPAKCMKIESMFGTLDYDTIADFILLDEQFNIKKTYVAGELGYDADNPINYEEEYKDILEDLY